MPRFVMVDKHDRYMLGLGWNVMLYAYMYASVCVSFQIQFKYVFNKIKT